MILVVNTIRIRLHLKINRVTRIFQVPRKTLANRLQGKPSRQDISANSRKLSNLEEEVII